MNLEILGRGEREGAEGRGKKKGTNVQLSKSDEQLLGKFSRWAAQFESLSVTFQERSTLTVACENLVRDH